MSFAWSIRLKNSLFDSFLVRHLGVPWLKHSLTSPCPSHHPQGNLHFTRSLHFHHFPSHLHEKKRQNQSCWAACCGDPLKQRKQLKVASSTNLILMLLSFQLKLLGSCLWPHSVPHHLERNLLLLRLHSFWLFLFFQFSKLWFLEGKIWLEFAQWYRRASAVFFGLKL